MNRHADYPGASTSPFYPVWCIRALPLNALANYQFTMTDPFMSTVVFLHRICPQEYPGARFPALFCQGVSAGREELPPGCLPGDVPPSTARPSCPAGSAPLHPHQRSRRARHHFTMTDPFLSTVVFLHRICPQDYPGHLKECGGHGRESVGHR
jgi:hypothetical protein